MPLKIHDVSTGSKVVTIMILKHDLTTPMPQINGARSEDVLINVLFNQLHNLPATYVHEIEDENMGISTLRQVQVGDTCHWEPGVLNFDPYPGFSCNGSILHPPSTAQHGSRSK